MIDNLRYGPKYKPVQIKTNLDFSRENGFIGALEMCNGAAVCRQTKAGTMCPSYMATKDENDTTRGRANALRNALGRQHPHAATSPTRRPTRRWILCLLQGLQDRVPLQRRHGEDQDGVPQPVL